MKKIFFILTLLLTTLSAWSEITYRSYYNSIYGKEFPIKINASGDVLEEVWIGVSTEDETDAYIIVSGKDLEKFRGALKLVRDDLDNFKYAVRENNIGDAIRIIPDIFPKVDVCWIGTGLTMGTAFNEKIDMSLEVKDGHVCGAKWSEEIKDSEIPNNFIWLCFNLDIQDFNNLIYQLLNPLGH